MHELCRYTSNLEKLARFESAGASALHIHTLRFGFDPGDIRDRQRCAGYTTSCWTITWVVCSQIVEVEIPRPVFAAQDKPFRFENAGASALCTHTLLFGFNPVDARDMSLIVRGVLATLPFVGPFCRSVGAQSSNQL